MEMDKVKINPMDLVLDPVHNHLVKDIPVNARMTMDQNMIVLTMNHQLIRNHKKIVNQNPTVQNVNQTARNVNPNLTVRIAQITMDHKMVVLTV
jgi:hypothetical protein